MLGPPPRPKLDPRNIGDLRLYNTDDLRQLYQGDTKTAVRLRDGIITRQELKAEILHRVWWERFGNLSLLVASIIAAVAAVIGACAAIVAAIESASSK